MASHFRQLGDGGEHLEPRARGQSRQLRSSAGAAYRRLNPQDEFSESESDFSVEHLRLFLRYRGTVLLVCLICVLAAVLFTIPQNRIFQAKTSIEIQNLNDDFLNMRDLHMTASGSPYSADYDIPTQIRKLQSRSLLERVVDNHPDLRKRVLATKRTSRLLLWRKALGIAVADPADDASQRQQAISLIEDGYRVRAQPNTRIVEIAVDSVDPRLAADIANTVAAEFVEQTLDERWRATEHTGDWLSRQMRELKIKLEKAEEEMQAYARTANLVFTSEKDNVAEQRLRELQQELSKAQAERVARQSQYELVASGRLDSLPEVIDDPTLREHQLQSVNLRRQLAELSSTLTPAHPKIARLQAQIATVDAASQKKRSDIVERVRNEYLAARRREQLLLTDYSAQARLMSDQADKVAHYNILKREVDTTRQLYDSMFQRVKEAGVASALRSSNIQVVDPARPPLIPYKPRLVLNLAVGLLAGVFLAVGVVLFRDRADRTIQAPGDSVAYLSLPELGVIPADGSERRRPKLLRHSEDKQAEFSERLELTTWERRLSPLAEAFRVTLTSILFSEQNGAAPKVLVVSSAMAGDGKTTVASNLAIALAQANHRVLIIDGDMRRPRLHDIFGVDNSSGLGELLAGRALMTVRQTKVPNLFVLPSGGINDANLLFAPLAGDLLRRLRSEFDIILIDTPPLLQMPDARLLARHADAVILVVRSQRTSRDAARLACERLAYDGTYIMGTILNDWKLKGMSGADGYKDYYYYEPSKT